MPTLIEYGRGADSFTQQQSGNFLDRCLIHNVSGGGSDLVAGADVFQRFCHSSYPHHLTHLTGHPSDSWFEARVAPSGVFANSKSRVAGRAWQSKQSVGSAKARKHADLP